MSKNYVNDVLIIISILLIISVQINNEVVQNLTVLAEYSSEVKLNCIAFEDLTDAALTWITPLSSDTTFPVSNYYPNLKNVPAFEHYSSDWNKGNAWEHSLNFVTDHRWEKFSIYHTGLHSNQMFDLDKKFKSVSLSFRTNNAANITLCEKKNKNCYTIMFLNNTEKDSLKGCWMPNKNDYCHVISDKGTNDLNALNENKWTHITIIRNEENFKINVNNQIFSVFKILPPKTLILQTSTHGLWKVQNYTFMWTRKILDSLEQIGPRISVKDQCIALFAAQCSTCNMIIKLVNSKTHDVIHEKTVDGTDNVENAYAWKIIKLCSNLTDDVVLYFKNSNSGSDGFWAIAEIHLYTRSGIRILNATVEKTKVSQWKCQSLHPSTNPVIVTTPGKKESSSFLNVNSLCSRILGFHQQNCENNVLCNAVNSSYSNCYCPSGYTGPECNTLCSNGWGYDCENKCGNCINNETCNNINGNCLNGCTKGFTPPKCLQYQPKLKFPPVAVKSSLRSLTVRLENLEYVGEYSPQFIRYQYKEINSKKWIDDVKKITFHSGTEPFTISELKPMTKYYIRALLFTANNKRYAKDDVPYLESKTTCRGAVENDFTVTSAVLSATISIKNKSNESCLEDVYQVNLPGSSTFQIGSLEIINLQPETEYSLLINNTILNTTVTKKFKTLSKKPESIKSLTTLNETSDSVEVQWELLSGYSTSLYYKIQVQHLYHLTCKSRDSSTFSPPMVYNSSGPKFLINDLKPYSLYFVKVAAINNFIEGPWSNTLEVTTMEIDTINKEEYPQSVTIENTGLTIEKIVWNSPVCSAVNGPLQYIFEYSCSDEWCNQSQKEYYEVNFYSKNENSKHSEPLTKLIPYSSYTLTISACRLKDDKCIEQPFGKIFTFNSLPNRPSKVRNLTVYEHDDESVSIRWKEPYPPYGKLYKYHIEYCTISCNEIETQPISCKLWMNYFCFKIEQLRKNEHYTITVRGINEGIDDPGDKSDSVTIKTIQDQPNAPENFKAFWKSDRLMLSWNHPNISNGLIKEFKFVLTSNNLQTISLPVNVTKLNYTLEVKDIHYATEYNVSMYGMNNNEGKRASLKVVIPPPVPIFQIEPFLSNCQRNFCDIIITNMANLTSPSYLYVIISNLSTSKSNRNNNDPNYQKILQLINITNKDQWIETKLELNGKTFYEKFSVDVKNSSKHIPSLFNSSQYIISIALVNQFLNKTSNTVHNVQYTQLSKTKAVIQTSFLYLLFLLVILPIIGILVWILYRRKRKKSLTDTRSLTRNFSNDEIELASNISLKNDNPKVIEEDKKPLLENDNIEQDDYRCCIIQQDEFEQYVRDAIVSVSEGGNEELDHQYSSIGGGNLKSCECGLQEYNKSKNRYGDLIAYDHSRVILKKIDDDLYSDYINANYINGYKTPKAYIATQNPKSSTINDFWRMIAQEKVEAIVMLTNLIEEGKSKCTHYWPNQNERKNYGKISIYNQEEIVYADHIIRTFIIDFENKNRKVKHFHFTRWPDRNVVLYPQNLAVFIKKILTVPQHTAPIVIHCSAGVGRTGTIILCDYNLRRVAKEGTLEFYGLLQELRNQRPNMVNTPNMYKLAHLIVFEALFSLDTHIPCNEKLQENITQLALDHGIQTQLDYLEHIAWQDHVMRSNSSKFDYLKYNSLQKSSDGNEQSYLIRNSIIEDIHYSNIDGIQQTNRFIATEQPQPQTLGDFWNLILLKEVTVVVSLNEIDLADETSCLFWPNKDITEMAPTISIHLNFMQQKDYEAYNLVTVCLTHDQNKRIVNIISAKGWFSQESIPRILMNQIFNILGQMYKICDDNSILVTCYDGIKASGLFLALAGIIEKIQLEESCDVCQIVRRLRHKNESFITGKEQFEYLYSAVLDYLKEFHMF